MNLVAWLVRSAFYLSIILLGARGLESILNNLGYSLQYWYCALAISAVLLGISFAPLKNDNNDENYH